VTKDVTMNDRIYKINELLKEEVGKILQKEISLEEGVLTVTAVETTNDLRQSTIWLGFFGKDEENAQVEVEARSKGIQRQVNHRLSMKHVPKIDFRFDKSGAYSDNINQLLRKIDDKH
jgi:ribosome-binding factor A